MQWKVVRRLAESLGYARLGRGEVQGPCFDNVLQARDVVMKEERGGWQHSNAVGSILCDCRLW
jgi:hypothetical protein